MSSLEPDQCNTKKFCIQKVFNAYTLKQYLSILEIACAFAIPYSMNVISWEAADLNCSHVVQTTILFTMDQLNSN